MDNIAYGNTPLSVRGTPEEFITPPEGATLALATIVKDATRLSHRSSTYTTTYRVTLFFDQEDYLDPQGQFVGRRTVIELDFLDYKGRKTECYGSTIRRSQHNGYGAMKDGARFGFYGSDYARKDLSVVDGRELFKKFMARIHAELEPDPRWPTQWYPKK